MTSDDARRYAYAAKAGIGQEAESGLETAAPGGFDTCIAKARHRPEPGAWFKFDASGRMRFLAAAGNAVNRRTNPQRETERTRTGPVAPQKAAALRIRQPLVRQDRLARENRIDQA